MFADPCGTARLFYTVPCARFYGFFCFVSLKIQRNALHKNPFLSRKMIYQVPHYKQNNDYLLLEDLVNWRLDLPKSSCRVMGDGQATLTVRLRNAELAQGFFHRETGIFATDPDDPTKEILYAYANCGDHATFIPAGTSETVWDMQIGIITVIGDAENVTAVIDDNMSYVSQAEMQTHENAAHPHPNIPNHYSDVTATTNFWATDEDSHLHRISTENARLLILGDSAGSPQLRATGRLI